MAWYLNVLLYLWELLKLWLSTIFVTPFKNLDMLWLLVPVWLSWFFAEFFQEKIGTSMGNAITNAVIALWGGIDCIRQTIKLSSAGAIKGFANILARYSLASVIFIYGLVIIILGIRGKRLIRHIGRVREVTYVFAIFVPVFYNAMPFSFNLIFAAILFFPLFYFTIELIDRLTPNPKAIVEDTGQSASGNKPFDTQEKDVSFDMGIEQGRGDFGYNNFNLR